MDRFTHLYQQNYEYRCITETIEKLDLELRRISSCNVKYFLDRKDELSLCIAEESSKLDTLKEKIREQHHREIITKEAKRRIAEKKALLEKAKFEEEVLAEMARIEASM
jgi:hypothetical protein